MPSGQRYRETPHQPALTAIFDLDAARAAPSFDKLWRDVSELLGNQVLSFIVITCHADHHRFA